MKRTLRSCPSHTHRYVFWSPRCGQVGNVKKDLRRVIMNKWTRTLHESSTKGKGALAAFKNSSGWGLMCLLVFAGLLSGCDASGLESEQDAVTSLSSVELIESMVMTPLPIKEVGAEQEYVLKVTMKHKDNISYPKVINLLGHTKNMPSSLIYDDGSGFDDSPNDLVFTGVVTEACSPVNVPEGVAAKDIFSITFSCEGDFIRPGQDCEGHGVCPEEVSRSFLWGLIEYDTNVAVCWCGIECGFDVEFKLGM